MTEKWIVCGTDELKGAIVEYIDYDGAVSAEKDGVKYRTEVSQDWGYCYCYDYGGDDARCSCTPTMTVIPQRLVE